MRIVWLILVSVLSAPTGFAAQSEDALAAPTAPLVAAASSLRTLWPELIEHYVNDTGGIEPRVSFASSGLLSTQIANGAPFEVFLSADLTSIERIPAHRLTQPAHIFALGSLSLVALPNTTLADNLSLTALKEGLHNKSAKSHIRLAIPSPRHAPYGKAAREALTSAGIWPLADGQLLAAENASQTLQFLQSGAVEAAIVPHTLLASKTGKFVITQIPVDLYSLVEHHVAIVDNAGDEAITFTHWILDRQAQAVLKNSGLQVNTP